MSPSDPPSGVRSAGESPAERAAISVSRIRKSFAGVQVLDVAGLDIRYGEVFGLVGENGAGKSTLVKILAGVHKPDSGSECIIAGEDVSFPIVDPEKYGMAFIHQDLAVYDNMTIAENIGIASHYDAKPFGLYRRGRENRIARELLRRFDLHLDPRTPCGALSSAERSLVAILRALRQLEEHEGRSVLVLDEPTAALSRSESVRLIEMVRTLASTGVAVIFIGHRLNEILQVCDRIGVLRSGSMVRTVAAADVTPSDVVRLMLGYQLDDFYPSKPSDQSGAATLSVRDLSGRTLRNVSLDIADGEILGVTGLMGMGQDELPYLLFGSEPKSSGEVLVDGTPVESSVRSSMRAGLALVPGNRHRDSIWALGTAGENLTIPDIQRFYQGGVLRRRPEGRLAMREMRRFGVRPLVPSMPIAGFSGGNQQKVVLARWISLGPKILLLHEPTQGVDAGARREVFELVRSAAQRGAAVLVVSSDIEEVANVCNRVVVLHHGEVHTVLAGDSVTEESITIASQQASAAQQGSATEGAPA